MGSQHDPPGAHGLLSGLLSAFELFKLARRFPSKPYVLGSFVRLYGFYGVIAFGKRGPVSREFMQFLRSEQKMRCETFSAWVPRSRPLPEVNCSPGGDRSATDEVPGGKPPAGHNA